MKDFPTDISFIELHDAYDFMRWADLFVKGFLTSPASELRQKRGQKATTLLYEFPIDLLSGA
jgi:hypothetical protein